MPEDLSTLFADWVKKEEAKLSATSIGNTKARAKRTYIHFDKRRLVSEGIHKTSLFSYKKCFLDPRKIITIPFWPFLKIIISEPRLKNTKSHRMSEKDKKVVKRKRKIKSRTIYYGAHMDSIVYSWYSYLLNRRYYECKLKELGIEDCVTAYRQIPRLDNPKKNKSSVHFSKEVFDSVLNFEDDSIIVLAYDIEGFFDHLDHDYLKEKWLYIMGLDEDDSLPIDHEKIYKSITKFKYVEADIAYKIFGIKQKKRIINENGKKKKITIPMFKDVSGKWERAYSLLHKPYTRKDFASKVVKAGLIKGNENWDNMRKCTVGIMQGTPISSTLANIYMIDFDKKVSDFVTKRGGIYRRYSDDIAIVCSFNDYANIDYFIDSEIDKIFLSINKDKKDITRFEKDQNGVLQAYDETVSRTKVLQYLGFEFNGHQIFIRGKSLAAYFRKMKSKIRKAARLANSKKSKSKNMGYVIFKNQLRDRFLFPKERGFLSYATKARKIMGSNDIKNQLVKRFSIFGNYIKLRKKIEERKRVEKNKKPKASPYKNQSPSAKQ